MEAENKIYYYESMNKKRGKLLNTFDTIEQASQKTRYSKHKIRKSINENRCVCLKEKIDGNIYKEFAFFYSGLKFEKIQGVWKRIIKYDDHDGKIYSNDNWSPIEESEDIFISDSGLVKTSNGIINRGNAIGGITYVRIYKEGKQINILLKDLRDKYFGDPSSEDNDYEKVKKEKEMELKNSLKEDRVTEIVKIDTNGRLLGYYNSYSHAAKENNIDWRTIKKYVKSGKEKDGFYWYSGDTYPINKLFEGNDEPVSEKELDEIWSKFTPSNLDILRK